ncbi:hypothetical protein H5T51_07135 [Candidatus Bathyarchaeota archaeon]|nr:hypothetical protein [Candidatus Bathyarchaeota archaeon]
MEKECLSVSCAWLGFGQGKGTERLKERMAILETQFEDVKKMHLKWGPYVSINTDGELRKTQKKKMRRTGNFKP